MQTILMILLIVAGAALLLAPGVGLWFLARETTGWLMAATWVVAWAAAALTIEIALAWPEWAAITFGGLAASAYICLTLVVAIMTDG